MDNIINKIIDSSYKVSKQKGYKFNYFEFISSNINKSNLTTVLDVIENNMGILEDDIIDSISFFYSNHLNNKNVQNITLEQKKNYIIFCIYLHIYHNNLDKQYINTFDKELLYIEYKISPTTLYGKILFENEKIINCYIKYITNTNRLNAYNKMIKDLIEAKCPMPYIKTNFVKDKKVIIIEDCDKINPQTDPMLDVLKDVLNQLKCINKYYYLEFIKPQDIGKSNIGFKRYFIKEFDSLIDKREKIKNINVYDGRETYRTITPKDQIRTIIHILSEMYVNGDDDYRKKMNESPFKEILEDINSYQESNIYDYIITKLLSNQFLVD